MQMAGSMISSLIGEPAVEIGQLVVEIQARFLKWPSCLGVFDKQDVCLDRRLADSEDIRDEVTELLGNIALRLRHC